MSRYFETVRKYWQQGLYTVRHLKTLERKGILSAEERKQIQAGK